MFGYHVHENSFYKHYYSNNYTINENYIPVSFNDLPINFQQYINKINSILYNELVK